ncbi:hypothetical protein Cadr_000029855 [Camelus dromedarius]|uniref:Uncharacterized protein n=1 Tax=Camelus dromedarius TaxID=9838 RepID=A0A5N4CCS7_CAMDR|nr:hypothetical protein Cadr_000029855 [Camelus dromedarius]
MKTLLAEQLVRQRLHEPLPETSLKSSKAGTNVPVGRGFSRLEEISIRLAVSWDLTAP